jgi:hypothetical protein
MTCGGSVMKKADNPASRVAGQEIRFLNKQQK